MNCRRELLRGRLIHDLHDGEIVVLAPDVHADPKFAEGRLIPYSVNEADVWNRKYAVSQLLALYRQRYAPAAGSPLVGAGDPADGPGSYIGAIGPGSGAPHDQFGRFLSAD